MSASSTEPTELEAWLAALGTTSASPGVNRMPDTKIKDAALLRRLILGNHVAEDEPSQISESTREHHWSAVRGKARQSGLFVANASAVNVGRFAGSSNLPRFALLAGVMAMVVTVGFLLRPNDDSTRLDGETIMRGDEPAQRIDSSDGVRERSILSALDRHRVAYLVHSIAGGRQVQAKVDPSQPVAAELRTLGVSVPAHGRLNLLFLRATGPGAQQ